MKKKKHTHHTFPAHFSVFPAYKQTNKIKTKQKHTYTHTNSVRDVNGLKSVRDRGVLLGQRGTPGPGLGTCACKTQGDSLGHFQNGNNLSFI